MSRAGLFTTFVHLLNNLLQSGLSELHRLCVLKFKGGAMSCLRGALASLSAGWHSLVQLSSASAAIDTESIAR